ncbi:recombinase family protein [Plantibacter sp. CFBP 8798]|uniref:recombinase family protein n=1 Tax=Plantibacter sp. CFBP 8798 TaxID=2775268 RepID=UPI001781A7D1|nr:recombinase family protein [Plantibacter sp. CFBP 8798]MBD8466805.1 recombinase family protein [Plantibacter sp. CFBP 8798]
MTPLRAVIYARVSQATSDAESVSITTQLHDLRALARDKGIEIVEELVDDGISGFKGLHRPGFSRLVAGMGGGRFDLIMVRHFDRLARNDEDSSLIRVGCARHGIRWMTQSGEITDPAAAQGGLMASITGALALYESKVKQERLKARYAHDRAQGRMNAGGRAFGYAEDKVTPHETEAYEVQKAFDTIINGGSIFRILSDWNRAGIPTTGKATCWSYPGVRSVLTNPRYAGLVSHRRQIIEGVTGQWTPLVTREKFEAVQAILTDPKRRTSPGSKPRYLGGGIYRCAVCEAPMRTNTSSIRQTGERAVFYRCTSRLAYDGEKLRHATVRVDEADKLVRAAIIDAHLFRPTSTLSQERDTSAAHAALGRLRASRQKLVRLVAADLISEADASAQLSELKTKEAALEAELTHAASGSIVAGIRDGLWSSGPVSFTKAAEAKRAIGQRFDELSVDERRELVRAFVIVTIRPGRKDKVQVELR